MRAEDRPGAPKAGTEIETLLGFLEYQRATLAWKCGGVDAAGLRVTVAASAISLGGLLRHMARVEVDWFLIDFAGRPQYLAGDWDGDWEPTDATPEELFALWEDACDRSRAVVKEALEQGAGLEQLSKVPESEWAPNNLRWILVHMVEEYARHNGHADLIREAVDGSTGE